MKTKWLFALFFALSLGPPWSLARADDNGSQLPKNAGFTTLITTPRAIEGLTGDNSHNLYTGGSGTPPCPVWEINLNNPALTPVGSVVPASGNCGFTGIAFNDARDLFVADGAAGTIYTFKPSVATPPVATVFASGAPGANGIAFDRDGNLWASDGTTGQGRVWRISGQGANCDSPPSPNNPCEEVFRIQPMANDLNPATTGGISNVGSDRRTLPPGTIGTLGAAVRTATNTGNSQPLVANGLAFNKDGDELFIADTARGAIWKAEFDRRENLKSKTGCDTTFTSNTLCLENIFVAHPFLEGADGIALDRAGNIWVDANERQAVVVVTKDGKVIEVFRNPVNTNTKLRNSATDPANNNRIVEFPTSPFLNGKVFCTANSDGNRRDNSPRNVGEIDAGAAQNGINPLGKISCMTDQSGNPLELKIPGLPLPID